MFKHADLCQYQMLKVSAEEQHQTLWLPWKQFENIRASGAAGTTTAKLQLTIMFFVHKDPSNGSKMDFPSSFIEQRSAAFWGPVTTLWQTQSRHTLKAGLFVLHS